MATAPTVQNLDDIIASLNPAYQQSTDLINQETAAVPAKYDAQRSALGAAKVQGFDTINNSATGRGLSFSGIPLDEQAKYLSTTYLPGLQTADANQNADQLALQKSLADLNLTKSNQALGIRQTQQSALDTYLQQQAQNEFTAQQAALDRAASAASAASSSSGGSSSSSSSGGYFTKPTANGGTTFYDPNGNPITAAQYISANGGSSGDLINFLQNDADPTSQKALAYVQKYGIDAAKSKYSYIFGGV